MVVKYSNVDNVPFVFFIFKSCTVIKTKSEMTRKILKIVHDNVVAGSPLYYKL